MSRTEADMERASRLLRELSQREPGDSFADTVERTKYNAERVADALAKERERVWTWITKQARLRCVVRRPVAGRRGARVAARHPSRRALRHHPAAPRRHPMTRSLTIAAGFGVLLALTLLYARCDLERQCSEPGADVRLEQCVGWGR